MRLPAYRLPSCQMERFLAACLLVPLVPIDAGSWMVSLNGGHNLAAWCPLYELPASTMEDSRLMAHSRLMVAAAWFLWDRWPASIDAGS